MKLDPLKVFEQPTLTPFVEECLTDADKNIRAGLFCAFMSYAVNRSDVPTALQSSFRQQQSLFGKNAFSVVQARELAMAQHGGKVEAKKCQTCQTVFLTETSSKSKAHCFDHRSPQAA
ncbi:hypothetical protein BH10PSE16_BH10PSE16_04080 [soil metagenome]